MLLSQDLLLLLIGEAGLGSVFRIGRGTLADAASADKDLGLQETVAFARFALHVVHRVIVLHIGIEAKNHLSLFNQSRQRQKPARLLKVRPKMARSLDTPTCEI